MPERTLSDVLGELREVLPKDRAYDALRVLVVEQCKHLNAAWRDTAGMIAFCPACHVEWDSFPLYPKESLRAPVGYILRTDYWQAAPNGATEGALMKALIPFNDGSELGDDIMDTLDNLLGDDGDTRIPAWEAVLEWVEVQP